MTPIAKDDHAAACSAGWCAVFEQVRSAAAQRGAHLAATVVLVPYAQLMGEARRQWQRAYPQGFAPRFETTRNWAAQLGAPLAEGSEYAGDMARDAVTARALLDRAGLAAHREVLSGPLLEMAAQLAVVAAAVAPDRRLDWGEAARALLPAAGDGGALRLEAAAARIALNGCWLRATWAMCCSSLACVRPCRCWWWCRASNPTPWPARWRGTGQRRALSWTCRR